MISASIIADSLNSANKSRITTFIVTLPRIVLAEWNTHRAFSRNSASSRAIPFEKMIEMVKTNPFIPLKFQKDHKGMQGTEFFEGAEHDLCVEDWLKARDSAVEAAINFRMSVTKQLRNRLLEPFMWHKIIVTATDYENFFALRDHGDAEIHIAEAAHKMLTAYNEFTPKILNPGDWHVPFGDKFDDKRMKDVVFYDSIKGAESFRLNIVEEVKRKVSVARCARISYNNFEGKDDYSADIKMCDKLFGSVPRHLSPAEHVAQAIEEDVYVGNFKGFRQYRYFFSDQNLSDPRVIKKWI